MYFYNYIFTYIKNDHKEIRTLLDQIENEGPEESELRTDLFNELKEKLLIHEHAEEEAFYKPLKQETSLLEDEIDESEEEHAETRDLLHQLTDPELVGEDWYDCFLELKEELIAHMDEEEDEDYEDEWYEEYVIYPDDERGSPNTIIIVHDSYDMGARDIEFKKFRWNGVALIEIE